MAASFYESLEEKSLRLFFVVGWWMLGIDEVLEGQKLQYYIGLIGLIRLCVDRGKISYWVNWAI